MDTSNLGKSGFAWGYGEIHYRQISNISRTKYQNLNVSLLVLQLSLRNPSKPGVKSRMKMQLEQRRQAMLQLHLSDQQFHCLLRCDLYHRFDGSQMWDQFDLNVALTAGTGLKTTNMTL